MNILTQFDQILRQSISEEIQPKDRLTKILQEFLAPKLHTDVPDGYCVDQGDAAISDKTLLTGGLAACTAVVITTATHNFVCHVDSKTDPSWLVGCIQKFIQAHGAPREIARYNCHGSGLNEFSERISREALETLDLFKTCKDISEGITGMHSVGAKEPGTVGTRLFAIFGKLKAA